MQYALCPKFPHFVSLLNMRMALAVVYGFDSFFNPTVGFFRQKLASFKEELAAKSLQRCNPRGRCCFGSRGRVARSGRLAAALR